MMRFLESLRTKSAAKRELKTISYRTDRDGPSAFPVSYPTIRLPVPLLKDIIALVCPHSRDDTYASSEDSITDGACPLCDVEDLAHCGLVNRQWNGCVKELLYKHVRIDAVHFCGRTSLMSKKRSSFNSQAQGNDPARKRFGLFVTSVRRNRDLALSVHTLKIPYMTREAAHADIARAIAAPLTNLRFIDLPEYIYRDHPSAAMLRAEIETNCPNLRWWKVSAGGESYLPRLEEELWPLLEELILGEGLLGGSQQLARIINRSPTLSKVSFLNLPQLDDGLFAGHTLISALRVLTIQGTPHLTVKGLLSHAAVGQNLKTLVLMETTIEVPQLSQILAFCSSLETLHVILSVKRPFPLINTSFLASKSLKKLKYEISASTRPSNGFESPADSYYRYLASSVLAGSLPSLVHLFALSARFTNMLFPDTSNTADTNIPLNWLKQTVHVYTKPEADLEWNLTVIDPHTDSARAQQSTRPLSLFESHPSTPFIQDHSRRSVMVGNGFGGYLMVPEQAGPLTPSKKSPMARDRDEWWAS